MRERLEYVRTREGFETLKEFHADLVRPEHGGATIGTYEAARTYHREKNPRPAATRYLSRIARVFGYRLSWLTDGEGLPKGSDEAVAERTAEVGEEFNVLGAVEEVLERSLGAPFQKMPKLFRNNFLELWIRMQYLRPATGLWPPPDWEESANELASMLAAPAVQKQPDGSLRSLVTEWNALPYYLAMTQALVAVLPDRQRVWNLPGMGQALIDASGYGAAEAANEATPTETEETHGDD